MRAAGVGLPVFTRLASNVSAVCTRQACCVVSLLKTHNLTPMRTSIIIINLKSCYFDKDNQRYAQTHICVKGVLHCASFPAQELFSEAPSAIGH